LDSSVTGVSSPCQCQLQYQINNKRDSRVPVVWEFRIRSKNRAGWEMGVEGVSGLPDFPDHAYRPKLKESWR